MLEYSLLQTRDTSLLVSLVRECYGNSYVHDYFYNANKLGYLIENKKLFSAVAIENNPDGSKRLVAHMAVRLEYDGDRTADNFAGMMLPEYRGKGILMKLGAVLYPVYEKLQLYGLQTSTVTHHAISQKISSNTGTMTCGCLLADSPGSNADGLHITTRMPILMQFYRFHPAASRDVYLPTVYHDLIGKIFNILGFPVTAADTPAVQLPEKSLVEWQEDSRRGTRLLRFHTVGGDMDPLLQSHSSHAAAASYIDMPLTEASAERLATSANSLGWFFAGIIPERAGTDFLRLQRCELPPPESRKGIIDPFGRELVDAIIRDQQRVTHRSHT